MFGRRRRYRRGFGGGGGGGLGMVLLAMQLLHLFQFLSNSNDYYPVTLGVLGLNLLAFFQPGRNWPSMHEVCISVRGAWLEREWKRVFLAPFYHLGDFHLYYNMASFIWKAISLESHYGSGYFLYMVAVFSVTTNLVYIAINYALAEILDQWSYINSCAVGFSGVLFALKVVTTHIQPAGMTRVMGFIPVPMRIACWVELLLISVLFPHVSFVGHLAGILVGFAFVYGPLKAIMDIPLSLLTGTLRALDMVDMNSALPDAYRHLVIVGVGLFMILSPLLIDLVPSGTRTGQQHYSDGQSYTYSSGTTGRRGAEQQQRNRPASQPAARQYHSYTYAAGPSGRGEREGSEEAELQEAIRRSLSTAPGERREERDEHTQTTIERNLREGQPPQTNPSVDSRPPPYNPDFPTSENTSPQPDVGWNRDILEQTGDVQEDSSTTPIGFEALNNSDPHSMPYGSTGTGLRHRRNETRDESESEEETAVGGGERERRSSSSGSLTREEMREARLLRLGGGGGGGGRERRPLSELSQHTFSFKK